MLIAKSVSKSYGSVTALRGLDLRVEASETICLLGANGAGKSTTLNLFMGFLTPDSGTLQVDGVSPSAEPVQARSKLAYIPENVALYPALTGLENLQFFDRLAGHRRSKNQLLGLLREAGLSSSDCERPVEGYSKGMRQKIGLAIAFAKDAKALLLDEPMSGLDPKAASEFTARLAQFREEGCAVLMATHDIFRAKECASKIGIMRAGELVELIEAANVDAMEIERIYLRHMHEDQVA